jgi:hypothetical protein
LALLRRFTGDDIFRSDGSALHLPPLRNLPSGDADARMVLVAGEAEVDEPLAVEGAGHRLQDLDAPLAVFDQVVVGGEDAGDAALNRERRSDH